MILCAGEALIDMLPRPGADGAETFQPFVGGSVFNTANALGRLGQKVGFFSGISTDFFGEMLMDTLTTSKVDTAAVARPDRPTTLAFVRLTDGHADYLFYDENSAIRMLSEPDLPTPDPAVKALFFGCISLAVEPCAATFEALMMRDGDTRLTMLDPNIRAGFIEDEARYRARLDRMLAQSDLVKFSDEDLHWFAGAGDTESLANDLLAKGPAVIFITEGARGVTGYTRDGAVFVPAPKVDVIDTVGAGDTFNAGVLTALGEAGLLDKSAARSLSQEALRDAMELGARAAAITVSRAGANPPARDEV
ncbi:MAG: carbohydrate kinase [Silicimonas sp.]|nr:carbohydrate kinase [Silicimonas sp.]